MPRRFEANAGQFDEGVRFVTSDRGTSLRLADDGAMLVARTATAQRTSDSGDDVVFSLKVHGGRHVRPVGSALLETKTNYLIGSDRSRWHTNVPNFGRVTYPSVLDGVDLVYHGEAGQLEYDFIVAPGTNPDGVVMDVEGADDVSLDESGRLVLRTRAGEFIQPKPRVFQRDARGAEISVDANYRLVGRRSVGFEVAAYDRARSLVIDPVISYATYLGGRGNDMVKGIATDDAGNAYVVGSTGGPLPVVNAFQPTLASDNDAFLAKINPAGTAFVYLTYFGGSKDDEATAVAVDANGYVYVTGSTQTPGFKPSAAPSAWSQHGGATDAFVAKFDPTGASVAYWSYIGGSGDDRGKGIGVDASGNFYVVGSGGGRFSGAGGLLATGTAFLAKFTSDGGLGFASFVLNGGLVGGLAVDAGGNAYVTGYMDNPQANLPVSLPVRPRAGGSDGFVLKVKSNGSGYAWGTFFGGSGNESAYAIAVDASGTSYVTGETYSNDLTSQVSTTPAQATRNPLGPDAFVARISPTGQFTHATYLGGDNSDYGFAIAVDHEGSAVVAGYATSVDFPLQLQTQNARGGLADGFVARLNPTGDVFTYSSYIGGAGVDQALAVAVDVAGNILVAGQTPSNDFPTTDAMQAVAGGGTDGFVAKIRPGPLAMVPDSPTVFPRALVTLAGSGGSGGYTFSLQTSASGGQVVGSQYRAGSTPDVVDVIQVRDSSGATATTNVTVGAGVSIAPATPSAPPRGSISFAASGGSGKGYVWSLSSKPSGGSISAAGVYVAGTVPNTVDVVSVIDSLGNRQSVSVSVGQSLALNPPDASTPPRGAIAFTTTGGSGTGLTWSLVSKPSNGSIDGSGLYTAGSVPNVTDVIKVTDSVGNTAQANVLVTAGLSVGVDIASTPPKGSRNFTVSGGSGTGIVWSFVNNPSGASLDPTSGVYRAGSRGNVTDVVRATDSLGNTASAAMLVTKGVELTPAVPATPPLGTIAFGANGGSGVGYVFALIQSDSGGTIDAATGVYKAGATAQVADTVMVTDSLGNTASVGISVGNGVSLTPTLATAPPRGQVAFAAQGGSGSFTWSLEAAPSGGSIDAASGRYTAGAVGSTFDTVRVTDTLGNTASTSVAIGPMLVVSPATADLLVGTRLALTVSGGSPDGHVWSFSANASGAVLPDASGTYVAGSKPGTDVLDLRDALGNTASVVIHVTAGSEPGESTPDSGTPVTPPGGQGQGTTDGGFESGPSGASGSSEDGGRGGAAGGGGGGEGGEGGGGGGCSMTSAPQTAPYAYGFVVACGVLVARRRRRAS